MRIERLLPILLLASASAFGQAPSGEPSPPATLEELLQRVEQSGVQQQRLAAERERAFLAARDRQAELLADIRARREAAEALADRLQVEFEQGEAALAELETRRQNEAGDLNELFSYVRQAAGDALNLVESSPVSAQQPDRGDALARLADATGVPSIDDLRGLWRTLLGEMIANGRIERFTAPVIAENGSLQPREVVRIGAFTTLSSAGYLRFLTESQQLLALPRQPEGVRGRSLARFLAGGDELAVVAVDPSRGTILGTVIDAPNLEDRVRQGGVIGLVIIALGLLGLVVAALRFVRLQLARRRLNDQRRDGSGFRRDLRRLAETHGGDRDALATRLDEFVTNAGRKLRWGLATLAIFAAVAPLLGLLGTVTGMIETFQVITLFGAGDPRLMSDGISQALVTTQLGLAVAIPLLLIHSMLQSQANGIVALLDEESANLYAEHAGRRPQPGGAPRPMDDGPLA